MQRLLCLGVPSRSKGGRQARKALHKVSTSSQYPTLLYKVPLYKCIFAHLIQMRTAMHVSEVDRNCWKICLARLQHAEQGTELYQAVGAGGT